MNGGESSNIGCPMLENSFQAKPQVLTKVCDRQNIYGLS